MLDTKEQKGYLVGIGVLILILTAVSFWHRPNFVYKDTKDYNQKSREFLNSKAYLDYLKTAKIDKQASQELFQTILTKEDIQKEVENGLNIKQTITPPAVDQKKIKTSSINNSQSINTYLTESVSQAYSFNTNTLDLAKNLFSGDSSQADQLKEKLKNLTAHLYATPVPKDALTMHQALIKAYLAYGNLLDAAKTFNPGDLTKNDSVWPEVYKNYAIANDSAKVYADELNKLAGKYKISFVSVHYFASSGEETASGNILIPEAKALFGIGDTVFNFTLGDIPRIIMDAVKEGLKSAFLKFMGSMLNKLVVKIEQNYMIANFLYYSDALINGQYVNDYLNKYVNDNLDKAIIKKFIPQFSCGKQDQNLKAVFEAKAREHLGFDPNNVSPNDPNYYQKMASVGDFLASPNGWQIYYQDLAAQTQSEAEKAVEKELTSSGLKTPRNTIGSSISGSINSIISSEQASFTALLQLGISNADSIISNVVAKLTETLVNQFVFQGVTGNNGNIAVLKEQPTCLDAYQLNPVLPLPSTQYDQPSAPPSPAQVQADGEVTGCIAAWDSLNTTDRSVCLSKIQSANQQCQISPRDVCAAIRDFYAQHPGVQSIR